MSIDAYPYLAGLATVITGPVGLAFSLTLLGAIAFGRLRLFRSERRGDAPRVPESSHVARELKIPVVHTDPDQVECAHVANRVGHLIATDDWDRLVGQIASWECRLESTPGGTRKHEIAIETCLAALQARLDDAPRSALGDLDAALVDVANFVARHNAAPLDPILATLAAKAHMMVARSCNADFWPDTLRQAAWRQMAHHYLKADVILAPFDPVSFMSPLLAGACYELASGMPDGGARRQPAFEDWIDLDPSNPATYAAHMPNLLVDDARDLNLVLAEAARAEDRTGETLGHGGYALALLPLLNEDARVRARMDSSRFAQGLIDLGRLSGTQAEVNWAAATLAREAGKGSEDHRKVVQAAFDAIVRRNLTVIYPRLWDMDLDDIRLRLRDVFERTGTSQTDRDGLYMPPGAQAA
jgi:hypothetical protein